MDFFLLLNWKRPACLPCSSTTPLLLLYFIAAVQWQWYSLCEFQKWKFSLDYHGFIFYREVLQRAEMQFCHNKLLPHTARLLCLYSQVQIHMLISGKIPTYFELLILI
jgi:hypothetical protein